ncbi:M23 family metallopeptidase [Candidatus Peregrinibacteria bacterium]|nr:M23 family metallopeptidase [Candidatus Peregrinibacteria bacterium]
MEEALVGIRIPDGYFNGINWQNIDASRFQWNKESACYKHVEPASEQAFALYIAREALLQDVDPYLVLATVKSSISDHLEPNDFENKFQWTLRALKDFEMDFEGEILQSARESDGFYSADFLARMTDLPMPLDVARVENIFEAYGIFSGKKYELPASYTLRPDHQQNWLDIESAAGEGIRALVPSAHRISSHFGVRRRPQTRGGLGSHNHQGLDISAPGGSSIRCYADGVVVEAQSSVTEGNYVEVDHGNGWRTRYLHCQGFGVEVGDKVKAGDIIASVGSTGRSSGPHLHFEMIHGSTHLNPERFLNRKWSD